MRTRYIQALVFCLACLFGATNLAAKPAAIDNGVYTKKDKEFYLTEHDLVYIRPGLVIEILEYTIPEDLQLEVTYSLKDPAGLPLDITGLTTPGAVDMRYMLAYIPQGEEQKVKLTPGTRDEDGTLESMGEGVYKYKFGTVLPDTYDADATYTLALVGRRDLREYELDRYVDNKVAHWVPSGLSAPAPRDVVTTETCNGRCHDPLAEHGGRYQQIDVCTQCHNPTGLTPRGGGDGRHLSFDYLIHEVHLALGAEYTAGINACEVCHTGGTPTENFPLVATPNPAQVCDSSGNGKTLLSWGDLDAFEIRMGSPTGNIFKKGEGAGSAETGKWVKDATNFFLVDKATGATVQKLTVDATVLGCVSNPPGAFVGRAGAQHTNWLDHTSRVVCGSCHQGVNFETGLGHSVYNIPQLDDNNCTNCHRDAAGEEFDLSVVGAHKELYRSVQMPGLVVKFIDIMNTNPGDTPTVVYSIGGKNGKINPNEANRVRFIITGPTDDYSFYVAEDANGASVRMGGNWAYTFETPIPMDAEGSYTVSFEGRVEAAIDTGAQVEVERDYAENPRMAFAVTDEVAVDRRTVVDDAKCEVCHSNLALHGGNRHNAGQYCQTCHNPSLVDIQDPAESVDMKWMTHKIHRGAELENGYVVVRSRGTYDFSHVEFPGDLRNCDTCHVNNSQQIELPDGLLPTVAPNFWWDPVQPISAACLSCHDGDDTASHAFTNTTMFGESCTTCHGEGKAYSVDKVHAR